MSEADQPNQPVVDRVEHNTHPHPPTKKTTAKTTLIPSKFQITFPT